MCVCVSLSICTFHPSLQPHMSTPHHIPGGTAAISVTKEPTNSFITQSTRAVMAPWAKLPQHNQVLWKCYTEQSSLTFTDTITEPKFAGGNWESLVLRAQVDPEPLRFSSFPSPPPSRNVSSCWLAQRSQVRKPVLNPQIQPDFSRWTRQISSVSCMQDIVIPWPEEVTVNKQPPQC